MKQYFSHSAIKNYFRFTSVFLISRPCCLASITIKGVYTPVKRHSIENWYGQQLKDIARSSKNALRFMSLFSVMLWFWAVFIFLI